jgi:hypothetical protein
LVNVARPDDSTILVRHILAGVRFLFVIKGRTFDDQAGQEANPYLRNLTEKARAEAFSLGPMLMALIRANLRKGSQKMRA